MYSSVKKWLNVPIQFKPYVKRAGTGTIVYGDIVDALCYPVGDVKTVTDVTGEEVVSTTTIYFDGSCDIKRTDMVLFEGYEKPIRHIAQYYRDGNVDMKVVYI